jgi:hypothetical protein
MREIFGSFVMATFQGKYPSVDNAFQGEVEEIDLTVKELRSQYLDTVAKIKGKYVFITSYNFQVLCDKFDINRDAIFPWIRGFRGHSVNLYL